MSVELRRSWHAPKRCQLKARVHGQTFLNALLCGVAPAIEALCETGCFALLVWYNSCHLASYSLQVHLERLGSTSTSEQTASMTSSDEQAASFAEEQALITRLHQDPYYIEAQPPYLSQLTVSGREIYHKHKQTVACTAANDAVKDNARFGLFSNRKFSIHRSEKLRLSCTEEDGFDKVVTRYLDEPFGKLSDIFHATPIEVDKADKLAKAFEEAEEGLKTMEALQSECRSQVGHSSELMPQDI